jgi:hypothetical protein
MLPTLPTLPARLRLSDSEGEEEDDADEDMNDPNATATNPTPHYHPSNPTNQSHQDYLTHQPFYNQHHQTSTHASNLSLSHPHPHPYPDELPTAPSHYDPILTDLMHRYRARKANVPTPNARTKPRENKNDDAHDDEAEEERTELLAHLLSKLRSEAARADDEAWMFGDGIGGAAGGVGAVESTGLISAGGGGYVGVGVGVAGEAA